MIFVPMGDGMPPSSDPISSNSIFIGVDFCREQVAAKVGGGAI